MSIWRAQTYCSLPLGNSVVTAWLVSALTLSIRGRKDGFRHFELPHRSILWHCCLTISKPSCQIRVPDKEGASSQARADKAAVSNAKSFHAHLIRSSLPHYSLKVPIDELNARSGKTQSSINCPNRALLRS